jgi:hypothetical protein
MALLGQIPAQVSSGKETKCIPTGYVAPHFYNTGITFLSTALSDAGLGVDDYTLLYFNHNNKAVGLY